MYMVYGKYKKTMKRFKPMDMEKNDFVTNKIYASIFYENELKRLKEEVDFMNEHNKDYIFEIRKA